MQGDWKIVQACSIGTSHIKNGSPCQDYAVARLLECEGDRPLVLAVCDGAGSAAHAEIGSERTASIFVELVEVFLDGGGKIAEISRGIVLQWLTDIRDEIRRHAETFEREPRDYSCTLLAAIIGYEAAAFVQVGDGAMVVSHGAEDGWSYVFWPQHGEFANSTNFVVSTSLPETMEFTLASRNINDIAIFSDGIEGLVLHHSTKSVHEPFFDSMFKPLKASKYAGLDPDLSRGLHAYLSSKTICDRTDDDKTLVMATRCNNR